MGQEKVFSISKKIVKASKTAESYNTGLVGEHIIVGAYKQMPIDKLEKFRIILNGIIKKKKEMKRVNAFESKKKNESKAVDNRAISSSN